MNTVLRPSRKPWNPSGPGLWLSLSYLLLGFAYGLIQLPWAEARETSAARMIAENLPANKTLTSATKAEVLAAVCTAVRNNRAAAAGIAPVAVAAHREYAGEIVGTVLRCSGKLECEFVGPIVTAASAVAGVTTTVISDAAAAKAPNCLETIREAIRRGLKQGEARVVSEEADASAPGALIGTSGGPDEGFDPHEMLDLVCDHGTPRAVRASQLDAFLRNNPGAFLGSCPSTPTPAPPPPAPRMSPQP